MAGAGASVVGAGASVAGGGASVAAGAASVGASGTGVGSVGVSVAGGLSLAGGVVSVGASLLVAGRGGPRRGRGGAPGRSWASTPGTIPNPAATTAAVAAAERPTSSVRPPRGRMRYRPSAFLTFARPAL